jgi:hypothetical protein
MVIGRNFKVAGKFPDSGQPPLTALSILRVLREDGDE